MHLISHRSVLFFAFKVILSWLLSCITLVITLVITHVLLLLLGVSSGQEILTVQCLHDIHLANIAGAWECAIKHFDSEKDRNEIFTSYSET